MFRVLYFFKNKFYTTIFINLYRYEVMKYNYRSSCLIYRKKKVFALRRL